MMNVPTTASVLARIARLEGLSVASMYIEGGTLYYNSVDGLRTVCQTGTTYWMEVCAELVTEALIIRLTRFEG